MALIVNKSERIKITYKNGNIVMTGKNIRGTIRITPDVFRSIYFGVEDYANLDVEVSN